MKLILPFLFFLTTTFSLSAQNSDSTVTKTRFLSSGLKETSTALKTSKNVKNGPSEISDDKGILAQGAYKDGKRYGRWRFFRTDTVEQIYNYTTGKVNYNLPDPTLTAVFDNSKVGDTVTNPIKIGGKTYGFKHLCEALAFHVRIDPGRYDLFFVLVLDSAGKLTKATAKITAVNYNQEMPIELNWLGPEDFEFVPGEINGKKVPSTFIFKTYLKFSQ
jgi:hypothetical protein